MSIKFDVSFFQPTDRKDDPRMRKKLVSTIMILTLCFYSAFAATPLPNNHVSSDKILTYSENTTPAIQPMAWPGDTAPIVTKIELAGYGWLASNPDHFGILLKVTGYGNSTATFNGKKVNYTVTDYFINYGTTADGFYHLYDCGTIPDEGGTYEFDVTYRSTSDFTKTLSFSTSFTFDPV